ncbi:MAG: DUF481 domain-containing protein [Bacteroidales bacterium]|nr:DUF481 domain-containing protein [Bacteroidales bacterium]MBN2758362.1 DUF481 domain-containing protein [Bacteroidales bacterium]
MLILKRTILFFIFILLSQIINSQVVNIEKKRKSNTDGFTGKVDLSFFITDIGKQILQLTNDIDLQYKKGANTILLINNIGLMIVDDETLLNNGFQHLRYNYTVKDSSFFTLEAFLQHQYNPVKLLSQRFLIGGGPRFRIVNSEKISFFLGALSMWEYEKLSDSLETSSRKLRFDNYMSLSIRLTENIEFSNITYYQPNYNNLLDYRISSESAMKFKITNALNFGFSFETTYDSNPPEDVQDLFYYLKNSLSYSF